MRLGADDEGRGPGWSGESLQRCWKWRISPDEDLMNISFRRSIFGVIYCDLTRRARSHGTRTALGGECRRN